MSPTASGGPGRAGRAIAALAILLGLGVAGTGTAAAVTPEPTEYQATVVDLAPPTDLVSVRILGGDAIVELTATTGHEVVVLGYEGEPYLRVLPDGRTEVNRRSPATSLNRARTAAAGADADADATASPEWSALGDGGTVRWHDHRTHAMSSTPTGSRTSWQVPLLVDGEAVAINGQLTHLPADPLWPWLLVGGTLAVIVIAVGWRRPAVTGVGAALVAGALTFAVGLTEWLAVPADVGRTHTLVLLPAGALVLAAVAAGVAGRTRVVAVLGAVALEGGWLAVRWKVLTAPLLVGPLAPTAVRALVTVAAAAAIAAAVLTVAGGEFAVTPSGLDRGRLPR